MSDYTVFGAVGKIKDVQEFKEKVNSLQESLKATIQLFDAKVIFGVDHLVSATNHALRSLSRQEKLAKTFGMEIMLYVAAERQITGAIDKLGIADTTEEIAIITIGSINPDGVLAALNLERADDVLNAEGKDHSIFNLIEKEMNFASASELVLERMALSELNR